MVWFYTLLSVFIVSLTSFVGALTFAIKKEKLHHFLLYMVSFSVGALFGDVFIHIIPEISREVGFDSGIGFCFLGGIILFFIVEKIIHWHHCHRTDHAHELHPMVYTNLIGDGLHNFLDGMIIAASFMVSVPLGIATTLAVVVHEIPQEIGDFGVLIYSGLTKKRALLFNFLSALLAVLGAVVALLLAEKVGDLATVLLAVAGGGFIYIAGSDLIPELHKGQCAGCSAKYQLVAVLLGVGVMALMLFLG
jgi:zinc and cadmium transporter